jgi:hypothetical protein
MKLEVGKQDGQVFCRFDKPHKLREMNVMQLKKLFKRTSRYSPVLAQSVKEEIIRRTERVNFEKELKKELGESPKNSVG